MWGGSACAVDGEGEAEDVVGAVVVGFVIVGDAGDCGGDEAWADGGVVEPDGFVSGVGAALDDESGGGSAAGGDLGAAGVPLVSEGVEESCAGEERDEFSGWGRFCEVDSVGAEFDEDAEVVEGFEAAGGVVGADADGSAEGGEAGDTDGFGDEARGFGVAEAEDLLGGAVEGFADDAAAGEIGGAAEGWGDHEPCEVRLAGVGSEVVFSDWDDGGGGGAVDPWDVGEGDAEA